jgi:hypothetical protein
VSYIPFTYNCIRSTSEHKPIVGQFTKNSTQNSKWNTLVVWRKRKITFARTMGNVEVIFSVFAAHRRTTRGVIEIKPPLAPIFSKKCKTRRKRHQSNNLVNNNDGLPLANPSVWCVADMENIFVMRQKQMCVHYNANKSTCNNNSPQHSSHMVVKWMAHNDHKNKDNWR